MDTLYFVACLTLFSIKSDKIQFSLYIRVTDWLIAATSEKSTLGQ